METTELLRLASILIGGGRTPIPIHVHKSTSWRNFWLNQNTRLPFLLIFTAILKNVLVLCMDASIEITPIWANNFHLSFLKKDFASTISIAILALLYLDKGLLELVSGNNLASTFHIPWKSLFVAQVEANFNLEFKTIS